MLALLSGCWPSSLDAGPPQGMLAFIVGLDDPLETCPLHAQGYSPPKIITVGYCLIKGQSYLLQTLLCIYKGTGSTSNDEQSSTLVADRLSAVQPVLKACLYGGTGMLPLGKAECKV